MTKAAITDIRRGLVWALAGVLMTSCTTGSDPTTAHNPDSGPPAGLTATTEQRESPKDKAIDAYRNHLAQFPDSPEYDSVSLRLADLLVEQAAALQIAPAVGPDEADRRLADARAAYSEAIHHYNYLLGKDPDGAQSTALLYQLARAYQASGQPQQSLTAIERLLAQKADTDLQLYADIRFRQGELLFADGAFHAAGLSYRAVVDLGPTAPTYEQSLYKLGWSLFKQQRYSEALPVLFVALESKVPTVPPCEKPLVQAEQEQVTDLLRVISRSFAHLGGVAPMSQYLAGRSAHCYEQQIYLALAQWYVEQEQINEAVETWLALAQRAPLDPQAPQLTARAIELYRQAGFNQRALELQAGLVQSYDMNNEFWALHSPAEFPELIAILQASLLDLSAVSHTQSRASGDRDQAQRAEQWYRQYLASFGAEPAAARVNFQLAELLFETGRYRQAAEEYERTAWSRGTHPLAVDAALGVIFASNELLLQADAEEQAALAERANEAALRFVANYPDRQEAPELLVQSGFELLQQRQYVRALEISDQLLGEAIASAELRQVAWSLQAQAMFALENYPQAEAAYRQALQLVEQEDSRRPALQQGLASATYKQAEQALAMEDRAGAITLFLQAAELAPDTATRSRANYDAAAVLLVEESWSDSIRLFEQFRQDYPQHELRAEASRRLAYAYQRSGDDASAAGEYLQLGEDPQLPEEQQREALLRAADIYLQTGAVSEAIVTRQRYLERFPEPPAIAVAQMEQLADLEYGRGDVLKWQHWLTAIIGVNQKFDISATRAAAAKASLKLAEQQLIAFREIRLVQPVQDNLARKIAAMERALDAFEAAIDYGIAPVTSAATYHTASMYDELGRALLSSERPARLSAEELAQYEALLVRQAAPFTQRANELYTASVLRSREEQRDPWAEKSVQQLKQLESGY
jgi:tetratricopeptide (TPR) repeat protein